MPDPSKTKEYYESDLKKKKKKLVKQSKIINQRPKPMENPNILDCKSSIIEHPKTFNKLFKTIIQAQNTSQIDGDDNPLYSETKKVKIV